MENSENITFPNLKSTISKIKEDFTFEKQYATLIDFDIIHSTDPDLISIKTLLTSMNSVEICAKLTPKENKSIACFLGLIVGDSLGNMHMTPWI